MLEDYIREWLQELMDATIVVIHVILDSVFGRQDAAQTSIYRL